MKNLRFYILFFFLVFFTLACEGLVDIFAPGAVSEAAVTPDFSENEGDEESELEDQTNPAAIEEDSGNGAEDQLNLAAFEIATGKWQLKSIVGTITCPDGGVLQLPIDDSDNAVISNGLNNTTIIFDGFGVSEAFELTLDSETELGAKYVGLGEVDKGVMTFTLNFLKHPNSQDPTNIYNYVIGSIDGNINDCKYHKDLGGGSAGFYQEGVSEQLAPDGEAASDIEVPVALDPESELQTLEAYTDVPDAGNWQITSYVDETKWCNKIPEPFGPSELETIVIGLSPSGEDMLVNGFGIEETVELRRVRGSEYEAILDVEFGITESFLSISFYPVGNDFAQLDGLNGVHAYWESDECWVRRNFLGEFVD